MDNKGIKISYETPENLSVWESIYINDNIDNIIQGFYGLCIAQGWQPNHILNAMHKFAIHNLNMNKNAIEFNNFFNPAEIKDMNLYDVETHGLDDPFMMATR